MDAVLAFIQNYISGSIGTILLVLTILGIVLAYKKVVVFYADFNDLAISAATFAVPAIIIVIAIALTLPGITYSIAILLFLVLFIWTTYKTLKSNAWSIWKSIIVLAGKILVSFVFVLFLYQAYTAKTRSARGQGWFVLIVLTPIMLTLVDKHTGLFALSSAGRLRSSR